MTRGIFVTGTDTGVGKTMVAAALLARFRASAPIRYWKPIQTGIEQDDDTATVVRVSGCTVNDVIDEGVRLERPLSPHLSARLSGVTIDVDRLLSIVRRHADGRSLIVEGAGGLLVPLNDETMMIDLIERLGLPVVIAARSGLGTINHTLLSVEALRTRGLVVAGIVMVGVPNRENRAAIEHYGRVAVLGELPWLEPLTPVSLQQAATALDPDGQLEAVLGARADLR